MVEGVGQRYVRTGLAVWGTRRRGARKRAHTSGRAAGNAARLTKLPPIFLTSPVLLLPLGRPGPFRPPSGHDLERLRIGRQQPAGHVRHHRPVVRIGLGARGQAVRRKSHVAACGSQAVGPKRRFRPPTAGEPPAATAFPSRSHFCGGLQRQQQRPD
nr:hypothetical protein fc90 [uncultured bacterium]